MTEFMLTTTDNPYDPFTQFEEWYMFDEREGYATCGLLARTIITSDELSIPDQDAAYDEAVDIIVKLNITGRYKKVAKPSVDE